MKNMMNLLKLILYISLILSTSEICVQSVVGEQSPHVKKVIKRFDIDLQTCIENFDIHKDKIIRTEDSRAMGAKYINEVDLGSREECLRMCCDTSTCDVFVFEEKVPGSCYLFHCGSPDDFKCKFTKHHNYTSAVLAVSRQLSELEDQIRLTKHEHQLSQLRKPEMAAVQNTAPPMVVATSAPATSPPPRETTSASQASNTSATQGRVCSRYQFECRSSGECIAIYNACDGIPQCADGSDEGPELDCPSPGTTQSSSPAAPPAVVRTQGSMAQLPKEQQLPIPQAPVPPLQRQGSMYPQEQLPPVQESQQMPPAATYPQRYRPIPGAWTQQQPPIQYTGTGIDSRGNKPYRQEGEGQGPGPGPSYNGPTSVQWSGFQQQQQRPQIPLQIPAQPPAQQQQPAAPYHVPMAQFPQVASREYEDQNSHIFTHKGNGLVSDSDRYNSKGMHPSRYNAAVQYSDLPHEYNKYGNNAVNGYYSNMLYRPVQNWQQQQQQQQQQNQPMTHDLNPMRGLEELPQLPHSQKLAQESMSGPYSGPPIPPDYYYEDSQEARYHPLPAHEQELVQHAAVQHGERENIADGAPPIQVKHQPQPSHQHHHKIPPVVVVTKPETPERKMPPEVHVKESEAKKVIEKTTPKPTAAKTSHEQRHASHHKKHPEPEVSLEESAVIIEPIDGEVGKPSGAILSLSLGLCITLVMVILVACRLRVVRKRLRRGGKSPYAHDADYLVNGMYL